MEEWRLQVIHSPTAGPTPVVLSHHLTRLLNKLLATLALLTYFVHHSTLFISFCDGCCGSLYDPIASPNMNALGTTSTHKLPGPSQAQTPWVSPGTLSVIP